MMDVEVWLKGLGLEQYAETFADNGVDAALLPELTNDDLRDLGVSRLADRKTILKAIAGLSGSEDGPADELPSPTIAAGERRQVTVLFADIAGYTKLSSELGAEETHGLLNRYFEAVDSIVEGYGGSVDKHMGDNVMAVFGAPVAHDDDPLRAVRAALDIHERMVTLSDEAGHRLSAHIGIASGQVVASGTGSDAHREYTVTGDSVNLASRLQDKAAPGETLISDTAYRAVAERVDCEMLGDIAVRGLDAPVRAWRVGALRTGDEDRKRVTFVGRRAERAQFAGVIEACRANGTGQVVVVRGEAGIGKTGLVQEFAKVAADQGYAIHRGLVLDFGVGKGQDAIRSVVRSLLGVAPGGGKALRQAAADSAISGGVIAAEQRVFLNDLLDLAQPVEDRAMYDAMDNATRNDGKRAVVADLIGRVSAASPIVVIVEDVHWADPLMLSHLATMADAAADCPTLIVMTSRIEGDPLDQGWRASTGGCPLMTVDLGPLRRDEALTLAGTFIDATEQVAQDCIKRAGGNPLFLEQLLRNAEERGDEEVPASIQSLVLARMDRLTSTDKRALQAASVIGQRFALDVLRRLMDDDGYDCAGLLEHRLARPEGNDYLFAHALIQEGVYSSLLKATRCELHVRAADWFSDHDPILHAQHLDRAESQNAAKAYLDAAEGQAALYRYERAQQLVARGLEIAQDDTTRFTLMKFSGELFLDLGQGQAAVEAFRAALDSATNEIQTCHALIGLASGMRLTDELEAALPYLDRAEGPAKSNRLDLELARLHHLRGNLYFPLGNIEGCREEHGLALESAQRAGSPEWEAQALGGLGDAEYARGRLLTAHQLFIRCFDLCRRHGFGRIEVANLCMVGGGGTYHYMHDLDAALTASLSAIDMSEKFGHDRATINANFSASQVYFDIGEFSKAEMCIERMKALVERIATRRFMARCLHHEGRIRLAQGHRREAAKLCRTAMKISRETGTGYCGALILATLARASDDAHERAEALSEGQRLLDDGCLSHNYYEFYIEGMEGGLERQDWESVERYAEALAAFTSIEPLPRTEFFIARGRALAAFGRGRRDDATMQELKRLCDEAERVGLRTVSSALNMALAAG
jgi:class 3 adenylate cyclase/tetratricopeptide (TPR) repeat protein